MIDLQTLSKRAKQSYDVAIATGTFRPAGIAIQMVSNLVVDGYTQPQKNAARDALRSIIATFPTSEKTPSSLMDHFTIAAVVVMVPEKMMRIPKRVAGSNPPLYVMPEKPQSIFKIPDAILATFEEYPAIAKGAYIYVASPRQKDQYAPEIVSMYELNNQLNI